MFRQVNFSDARIFQSRSDCQCKQIKTENISLLFV